MKPREAKAALLSKGFVQESGKQKKRDHTYFFYYHEGKKTNCYVKFSESHDDLDVSIMSRMVHPLQMDKLQQVRDLLECPMSQDDLIAHLSTKGSI